MTKGQKVPYHYIRLTNDAKQDLNMWSKFLESYNGKSLFGGTYGSFWIQGSWPEHWKKSHIAILEVYPILALVNTFGHKFANSAIVFHCDNQAVVEIINKQSSKDPNIMAIIRP